MEHSCEDCDFIKRDLVPEMVQDRCFCEPESREFVELDSVTVEHLDGGTETTPEKRLFFPYVSANVKVYRVTADVLFSDERSSFPLIVRLHANTAPPFESFQNEELFYTKMTRHFGGTDCAPKCYLSDLGRYGRPVIVLEDLTARGYADASPRKLDEHHLRLCVKTLATFHARGLKLKASQPSVFKEFCANLWNDRKHAENPSPLMRELVHEQKKLLQKMIESPLFRDVSATWELYIDKMQEMDSLSSKLTDVSTICHGRFLGNNVLFGCENGKLNDARIMNWDGMRLSTPALDLGTVLMANLPDEDESPTIEAFCREILEFYVDAVKNEYPEVNRDLLQRDILEKLPSGFFNLSRLTGRVEVEVEKLFCVLEGLRSYE